MQQEKLLTKERVSYYLLQQLLSESKPFIEHSGLDRKSHESPTLYVPITSTDDSSVTYTPVEGNQETER